MTILGQPLKLSSGVPHPLCFGLSFSSPVGSRTGLDVVIYVTGCLRVCPIHLQRLWRISSSAGCCLVSFQSSLSPMVTGHRIRRTLLKQVLTKCLDLLQCRNCGSPCSSCIQKGSFTVLLKILILTDVDGQAG